jgi:hypothetical protein
VSSAARSRTAGSAPAESSAAASSLLRAGLIVYAAVDFALALSMVATPHTFYTSVGPFGAYNVHYLRDTATFNAALGLGLVMALSRPSWRVPVLTITAVQFALHSANHLVDIDKAHPAWTGYFDFFSLAASTLLLAWLVRVARAEQSGRPHSIQQGDPP